MSRPVARSVGRFVGCGVGRTVGKSWAVGWEGLQVSAAVSAVGRLCCDSWPMAAAVAPPARRLCAAKSSTSWLRTPMDSKKATKREREVTT